MTLLQRVAKALFDSDESWKRTPRKWEEQGEWTKNGYLRLAKAAVLAVHEAPPRELEAAAAEMKDHR